jgi:hypothetical protein
MTESSKKATFRMVATCFFSIEHCSALWTTVIVALNWKKTKQNKLIPGEKSYEIQTYFLSGTLCRIVNFFFFLLFFFLFLYSLLVFLFIISIYYFWEYIVTFTKVATIYQMYLSWIHPLHHSPLFPLPYSSKSFKRSHFSIYIHAYTIFAPHSPSYTFPLHPTPSRWYQPPRQDPFWPPILRFCKQTEWTFCLRYLYKQFPHDINMYIFIITRIGSVFIFFS